MAELVRYKVRSGHVHRAGVRCVRGHVLELDSTLPNVTRAEQIGRLVRTDEDLVGALQTMKGEPLGAVIDAPLPDGTPETLTELEAMATALLDQTVEELTDMVPEMSAEVLAEAQKLELAKAKPRKGALEAIRVALPETGE